MAASNTRFTQNSLGQSKNLIDSDHGIYRGAAPAITGPITEGRVLINALGRTAYERSR